MVAGLGILGSIAARFSEIKTDAFASISITFQTIITALATGALLTSDGRSFVNRLLLNLSVPSPFHQEFRFGISLVFLLAAIYLNHSLPSFSQYYQKSGLASYYDGELIEARQKFELALSLDPGNELAHYDLGVLHEDLGQIDLAKDAYSIALFSGASKAYNNLGRLEIIEGNLAVAVQLLSIGLSTHDNTSSNYDEIRYYLLKNLGWARLEQERYEEAKSVLLKAIEISSREDIGKYIGSQASAHCLLAQVLEHQNLKNDAMQQWELCSRKANSFILEEDQWRSVGNSRKQEYK